ncbi:hypothetical protein PFISCL1PPCAC_1223, partial [Pristionchus fissidentatus]
KVDVEFTTTSLTDPYKFFHDLTQSTTSVTLRTNRPQMNCFLGFRNADWAVIHRDHMQRGTVYITFNDEDDLLVPSYKSIGFSEESEIKSINWKR